MRVTKATRLKEHFQQQNQQLTGSVASVALAVEALEGILTEKRWRWPWQPVMQKDELMKRLEKLAKAKFQTPEVKETPEIPTIGDWETARNG